MKEKLISILKKIKSCPLTYIMLCSLIVQKVVYGLFKEYTIFPDSSSYIEAFSKNILKGEVDGLRTPIYPYFCKLISFIGGNENMYSNIVLAQKLLFFISIVFFFYTLKKLTKNKWFYIIGTLVYSTSPLIFMWNANILTESISIFEAVLLFYLTISYIKKPNKPCAILMGFQLLIMILTRPSNIYLIALYLFFWILRLIRAKNRGEKQFIIYGFAYTFIAIVGVLLYCNQVRINYGTFGLSAVNGVNNRVMLIDSRLYYYGDNKKIIKDINKIYKGDEASSWDAVSYIVDKYGEEKIDKYYKKCISNAKTQYLRYLFEKTLKVGNDNIGTIYSIRENDYPVVHILNFSKALFPISFDLTYAILVGVFIYLLYFLFVKKRIEWTIAALFTIITGNIFVSIVAAPYETVRLCIISVPAIILLIIYIISIIFKSDNKDPEELKLKTKNKKKQSNIEELISYIFEIDIDNLFRAKTNNTLIQFFRYFFVGGIAAVVNIGFLYLLTDLAHFHYIISNIISFTMGLVVNYILSKKFVFQEETTLSKSKEFIIYAIIGVIGLGIDTLLIWLFTDLIHIYYMVSKIISTMLVFIWNFGARKVLYKIIK